MRCFVLTFWRQIPLQGVQSKNGQKYAVHMVQADQSGIGVEAQSDQGHFYEPSGGKANQ